VRVLVAKVMEDAVVEEYPLPSEVMPLLILDVATHVGTPPERARTKPLVRLVEMEETPLAEEPVRTWLAAMAEVVARPVHVMEELVPPTREPKVPAVRRGEPETVRLVVATLPSLAGVPFVVVQYEREPAVSPVEVARYEERESVPVFVMVPPRSPVPAVMLVTPLLMEEVATHCGTPLFQASTCPPVPAPWIEEVALQIGRPVVYETER
jgi:hypothetical protein